MFITSLATCIRITPQQVGPGTTLGFFVSATLRHNAREGNVGSAAGEGSAVATATPVGGGGGSDAAVFATMRHAKETDTDDV